MEYSKECKDALLKIDYESLLDAVIYNFSYDELVESKIKRPNLLDIPEYNDKDKRISDILNKLISRGEEVKVWEQDERKDTFKHIAINREFHPIGGQNKFRLYLSPEDNDLYYIIFELIKRTTEQGRDIYLKYSRENRIDKILMYLKNKTDVDEKIKLLEEIKKDYPTLFQNMEKSIGWISKTSFEGVYITTEKLVKRCNGTDYDSYTILFSSMINEMRMLLLYNLGDINMPQEQLEKYDRKMLYNIFGKICIKVLGKYGVLLYNEGEKLNVFTNEKFPGVEMPLNEDISVDIRNNFLEIGIRINGNIFRYYQIPASSQMDLNNIEYNKLTYYDMDINDHIKKILHQ